MSKAKPKVEKRKDAKAMTVIERLLLREEIDALELDLAAARGVDWGSAQAIEARISRLEAKLRRDIVAAPGAHTPTTYQTL